MSRYHFWMLAVLLVAGAKLIESAKILALCGIASKSHHLWNTALLRELGSRGHEITYISPDIDPSSLTPNITRQIPIDDFYKKLYQDINLEKLVEIQDLISTLKVYSEYDYHNTKIVMESKGFEQLLEIVKNEKFDLLMYDITFNAALLNVADYMGNVPIIALCAYGGNPMVNHFSGSPESLSVLPNTNLGLPGHMGLWQRMQNAWTQVITLLDWYYVHMPQQTKLARTKFPNGQDLNSIFDRFSLYLLNTDISFDRVVPRAPAVISVGGLAISKTPKPLPKEIQTFLDEAKHGVVLFSLGTNLKSDKLDPNIREILVQTFKELAPVRVLWKFESDFPNAPSNLMTRKWLPLNDILAHPNIRLFITHSGLLSTLEATYRGVPVLGVPFYADQFFNIDRCKLLGYGEKYDIRQLNKETFLKAITNMLHNPKYKENAEKQSKIFQDQPQTPLERAVFWTEYVIRHKGAPHLRADSLRLSWYQNVLLDVIAISLAAVLIPLHLVVKIVKRLCKSSSRSDTKKLKKQ